MSTASNQQEPSMEEILSSIRRIISDEQEEGAKPDAEDATASDAAVDEGPAAAALADEPEPVEVEAAVPEDDHDEEDEDDDVLDLTDVVAEPEASSPDEPADDDGLESALTASVDEESADEITADSDEMDIDDLDLDDVELAPIEDDEPELDETVDASAEEMSPVAEPEAEPAPMQADIVEDKPDLATKVEDSLVSDATAVASAGAMAKLAKVAAGDPNRAIANGDKTVEQFMVDLIQPMLKDWLDANLNTIVERVVEQEVKKLARRAELM